MREAAWALGLALSTLNDWNRGFDHAMQPLIVPDHRGKKAKITVDVVRIVVNAAKKLKAQRRTLRLSSFTNKLAREEGILLSRKKVTDILIANGLYAGRTRKRRPHFYQSLRQTIPNGLVSADGSEFTVSINDESFKFNVELAVDVDTFTHTAFSVADTENSAELFKVLEAHRKAWGSPLGLLCDHGSANLSIETAAYLKERGIEPLPVGPKNPKGNGTVERAFGEMKKVVEPIHLKLSSPRELAKSVLEKLIAVYIHMRNRLPLRAETMPPKERLATPVDPHHRHRERQRITKHLKTKAAEPDDQAKLDRLHYLIGHYELSLDAPVLRRAEHCIKAYDLKAVRSAEEAFVKAVNRKKERLSLPYFFGILRRIQQEHDADAYRRYCSERYNHQAMLETAKLHREQAEHKPTVNDFVAMLHEAVVASMQFVKELAIRRARHMAQSLMENCRYLETLKKQIADALVELKYLSLAQKQKAWELVEQFLSPKTTMESVTLKS